MKKIFKSLWLLSAVVLLLGACKKDEVKVKAKSTATPSKLEATYDNLVLTEANASADVLGLTWNPTNYGYDAAVTYTLELGKKDSNFVNAKTIAVTPSGSTTLTVSALNVLVNQMNAVAFEPNNMEIRLKAIISESVAPTYSNVIPLAITPYLDKPPYQTLYLVGDATEGGWDNAKGTPIYRDAADAFLFTYTGYFKAGYFKFIGTPGQWTPMWGSGTGNIAAFRKTDADPDPASFQVTTAGYYTVTLSLKNNAWSMAAYNAAGAKTYTSIGLIGPFTDWSSVIPMTKSTIDPHKWIITHEFAADVEMKYRIAENWDSNWGAVSKPAAFNEYGDGQPGGENFQIKKGKYTFIFDDLTLKYVFIKL